MRIYTGIGLAAFVLAAAPVSLARADCYAQAASTCKESAACTQISGTFTNNFNDKIKLANIVVRSLDDDKKLAAATVVFTGTSATPYDPTSNTPPSGLSPGDTSAYTISTAFPLAALSTSVTCAVETVW